MKELLALARNRQEYLLIATICAIPGALSFTSLNNDGAKEYIEERLKEFRAFCS